MKIFSHCDALTQTPTIIATIILFSTVTIPRLVQLIYLRIDMNLHWDVIFAPLLIEQTLPHFGGRLLTSFFENPSLKTPFYVLLIGIYRFDSHLRPLFDHNSLCGPLILLPDAVTDFNAPIEKNNFPRICIYTLSHYRSYDSEQSRKQFRRNYLPKSCHSFHDWCRQVALDGFKLPSFKRNCPPK